MNAFVNSMEDHIDAPHLPEAKLLPEELAVAKFTPTATIDGEPVPVERAGKCSQCGEHDPRVDADLGQQPALMMKNHTARVLPLSVVA